VPYKDPEKRKELQRRWRKKHPEKVREQRRLWRKKDPENVREMHRRWRKKHPENVRECKSLLKIYGTSRLPAVVKRLAALRRVSRDMLSGRVSRDEALSRIHSIERGDTHEAYR